MIYTPSSFCRWQITQIMRGCFHGWREGTTGQTTPATPVAARKIASKTLLSLLETYSLLVLQPRNVYRMELLLAGWSQPRHNDIVVQPASHAHAYIEHQKAIQSYLIHIDSIHRKNSSVWMASPVRSTLLIWCCATAISRDAGTRGVQVEQTTRIQHVSI
jgi:hypothetical protein